MTRWAMVADLRRCVGCQTCTAACRHANATPPGVQWRRVLDMEFGEYPDVQRAFVPVGCQHCDDPPCMDVCPTKATKKRADGIVTIDYDLCIGCAYCAVACPYQARYKTLRPTFAYGRADGQRDEAARRLAARGRDQMHVLRGSHRRGHREGPAARHRSRSDARLRQRVHLAGARVRRSRRSATATCRRLLAENQHFRMHEELGTGPGFYYLWDADGEPAPAGAYPAQGYGASVRILGNRRAGTRALPATSSAAVPGGGLIVFTALCAGAKAPRWRG